LAVLKRQNRECFVDASAKVWVELEQGRAAEEMAPGVGGELSLQTAIGQRNSQHWEQGRKSTPKFSLFINPVPCHCPALARPWHNHRSRSLARRSGPGTASLCWSSLRWHSASNVFHLTGSIHWLSLHQPEYNALPLRLRHEHIHCGKCAFYLINSWITNQSSAVASRRKVSVN
jgi:hypothetical protein